MAQSDQPEETYSEAETEARAAAALKRMLATPHKRQEPLRAKREKRPL